MNLSVSTPQATAQKVWSNATRNLTGFGTAITPGGVSNQTLAASGTISFVPAAALFQFADFGLKAGAAGTFVASITDGTNLFQIVSIAAAGNGRTGLTLLTQSVGVQLKNNDAANAATYSQVVGQFTQ